MGLTKVIQSLLDIEIQLDDWDSELGSPLHFLPVNCTVQCVGLLKASFPLSPRRSIDGKSPFEWLLTKFLKTGIEGNEQVLRELLPEEASDLNHLAPVEGVQMLDGDVVALMHHAACLGRTTIVRFLHRHGADINIKTRNGSTPLHLAVQTDPLASPESHGGEAQSIEVGESHLVLDVMVTALLDAIVRQDIEACTYLKNIGCPMDMQLAKGSGMSPLMAAIRLPDCLDAAEWLLDNGASVSGVAPPWPSRSSRTTRFYTALEAASCKASCNRILSKLTWRYFQEGRCFLDLARSPIHAAVGNPQGLSIILRTLQEIYSDGVLKAASIDCDSMFSDTSRSHISL